MYAVIRTGGKQYRVSVGDVIDVERLAGDGGATLELAPVLVVDDEGKVSALPRELEGAKVTCRVLEQRRGRKIRVFTYKSKTGQQRTRGHRQHLTRVQVEGIHLHGAAEKTEQTERESRGAEQAGEAQES